MERIETLCLKDECIYRHTCTKWLMNIPEDDDAEVYPVVMEPDTKRYTCYMPVDGMLL